MDDYGLIVFAVDTSGSCDSYIPLFLAHGQQLLSEINSRVLRIDCDAAVQGEWWLEAGGEMPMVMKGGGGTSHVPVWERVQELIDAGEHVAGVVCITDGATCFGQNPDVPVLWLFCGNRGKAPFGRTITIES